MDPSVSSPPSFSRGRKWGARLNVFLAILAVLAIVVMANYLGARRAKRVSWGADAGFQLSPLTHQVLRGLTNQIKVTVYFDPDEVHYGSVMSLLREYALASPKIVLDTINHISEPAKAELFKAQYRLAPNLKDFILVEHDKRARLIQQSDLSEYDLGQLMRGEGKEIQRKAFLGERLITSAIITVTDPRQQKAYFLFTHGEHNPAERTQDVGYGRFAELLRDNNVELGGLALTGTNDVPADCSLLIIAGPQTPFDLAEIDKLDRYLRQGGRLLLLMRYKSRAGLNPLLAPWGVELGDNVVVDKKNAASDAYVVVGAFGSHAVVRPLSQAGLALQMAAPRSVSARSTGATSADAPQVVELVTTSPEGVAVSDLARGARPSDRQGAIPLMAAVEKGSIKGVNLGRGSTRLVVAGDSFMLDNQMMDAAANRDFAWQAVNWLLDRSVLIGNIGPRPVRVNTFTMTDGQMRTVRWLLLGAVPGAVLGFGLLVWWRRQR